MRRVLVALVTVTPLAGCFGAQYIGMIIDHKAADPLVDRCQRAPNGSVDDALCDYLGRPSTHVKAQDPAVAAAGALVDRDGDLRYDTPRAWARAQDVDLDALDRTLSATVHDREIGHAFVIAVRNRKQKLDAYVAAQSAGWRAVYVDPVVDARARWDRDEARRAPWLAKAKALGEREDAVGVTGTKDPSLLGDLVALQRAYVADCRKAGVAVEDCLGDEVARPVTRRIVRLAWASGDKQLAAAQNALFDVPDVSDRAFLVRRAVKAAVEVARADRKAWEQAKAENRSEAAMHARWPVEPIEVDDDDDDLPGAVPGERDDDVIKDDRDAYWPAKSSAAVASVARKGDRAVISFKRDVETSTETAECHETNRVDSIDSDGRLHYREECSGSVTEQIDLTEKPITVPAAEAAAIRAGEVVTFVADDHRRGHVLEVHAPDPEAPGATLAHDYKFTSARIQIGEYRLSPAKATAKASRTPR
jgi:hypothetical protein